MNDIIPDSEPPIWTNSTPVDHPGLHVAFIETLLM